MKIGRTSTSCTGAFRPFSGAFSIFHTLMFENYPRDRPPNCRASVPGYPSLRKKFLGHWNCFVRLQTGQNRKNRRKSTSRQGGGAHPVSGAFSNYGHARFRKLPNRSPPNCCGTWFRSYITCKTCFAALELLCELFFRAVNFFARNVPKSLIFRPTS